MQAHEQGTATMFLYKKIDKSMFRYGTTVPDEYVTHFTHGTPVEPGKSREVVLHWTNKNKDYAARLVNVNRKKAHSVYQIRWDSNYELMLDLKREFIQSYLAIESRNYQSRIEGKRYVTNLSGGNQEVLIFKPMDIDNIVLETFIQVPTPYDSIFRRLIEENVFGWLSNTSRDRLVTKSSRWFKADDLEKHVDAAYVIYYLVDEDQKEVYIGSAIRLGDRVKIGRSEIPGWNKFRYEILHPDYHHLLRRVEFLSIGAFAGVLPNNGKVYCLPISDYKLVNRNWSKAR